MKAKPAYSESVAEVMARVSHIDLLAHYLGIYSLPTVISSPLRTDDQHPSFFIFSPDGIKVLYRDYATGDRGDIYTLLTKLKGVSFADLIREIASESAFKGGGSVEILNRNTDKANPYKNVTDLKVKIRDWEDYDLAYWESYGITLPWLKFANVYPISHKIVYKNGERYVFHAARLSYVFVERKEGKVSLKVYSPMSKKYKWSNSNDGSVVGLWTKIPEKGNRLCICSSLKDALCLWINVGIPAVYVQSETTGLSNTAQEVLRNRFKHIFVCFDNDAPGLIDGETLALKTGFKNVVLPFFEGGKDISDLFKVKGKNEFINIMKPLFDI